MDFKSLFGPLNGTPLGIMFRSWVLRLNWLNLIIGKLLDIGSKLLSEKFIEPREFHYGTQGKEISCFNLSVLVYFVFPNYNVSAVHLYAFRPSSSDYFQAVLQVIDLLCSLSHG